MARKTKTVTIETAGRDQGKSFLLTEMGAVPAEKWATRALVAVGRAGIEVDEDALGSGFAGLFLLGLKALMRCDFDDAEPLLDEMMECVQFVPATGPRTLHSSDIEEPMTIVYLRDAVMELHTGFSVAATLSTLGAAAKAAREAALSAPPTSPEQ